MNKYLLSLLLLIQPAWALNCHAPKKVCVEAGATKYFDGVAVTLDCWRYKTTFTCKAPSDNNCQLLRDQGCALIDTTCRSNADNICAVQDLKYSCPVERCNENGPVVCGKALFCLGGVCTKTVPKLNHNLDKTTAVLAALGDAAKQITTKGSQDPNERFIFAGHPAECSCGALNTVRCCGSGRGWAQGIVGCKDSEKLLAEKKEDQLTVEVGEYCYSRDSVLNSCLSRHKVYCVFDSKIARIVQYYGRFKQLGRNFGHVDGDDSNPDCSGISIDELRRMDFKDMDFSAIYAEISAQVQQKLAVNHDLKAKIGHPSIANLSGKMAPQKTLITTNSKLQERVGEFYERLK